MRVFFAGGGTGGHLFPGLAIARALRTLSSEVEPYFIGAERGIERDVLPQCEFEHTLLDLHPLYRSAPWKNWHTVRGGVSAARAIGDLARREMPHCVVGTGGYAAAATLAWGRWRGVPLVLHESDSLPGKVTRMFAPHAHLLSLGFPEARERLSPGPETRVISAGNPITPPEHQNARRVSERSRRGIGADELLVLVVGGSQGSAALNAAVSEWVRGGLAESVRVLWSTGRAHFEAHASLASAQVMIEPFLAPIGDAYAAADVAVTRAGAMTIAELCAWGVPSVLVPLPTAARDHQTHNARTLAASGASVLFPQSTLSGHSLSQEIARLVTDGATLPRMAELARARAHPNAAADIATAILERCLSHS